MDKATRKLRARMKAERGQYGQAYKTVAPRGLGKADAPSVQFPNSQCSFIEGGEKIPWKRKRKDGTTYTVMLIVGGQRCLKTADTKSPSRGWRCLEHCGSVN
jgi:hypothetical protein